MRDNDVALYVGENGHMDVRASVMAVAWLVTSTDTFRNAFIPPTPIRQEVYSAIFELDEEEA